jgi:hypothetical protein
MSIILQLWLPILVASVLVFIASSIIHMLTRWHAGDYKKFPDEEKARAVIGALNIPPGDYGLPRPKNMKDMGSPEFQAKLTQGPRMIATVQPNGSFSMGSKLGAWFLYIVIISCCSGLMAGHGWRAGADHRRVFHFAAFAALLGYSGALSQMSIWFDRSWGTTIRSMIDGVIFAVITGETFALLWPR